MLYYCVPQIDVNVLQVLLLYILRMYGLCNVESVTEIDVSDAMFVTGWTD
jgi:hypothetical protein